MILDSTLNTQTVLLDYKHTVIDKTVSYTHLDVYKRQACNGKGGIQGGTQEDLARKKVYTYRFTSYFILVYNQPKINFF